MNRMMPPRPTPDEARAEAKEVLDRVRRIETRVTRFMEAQGFDTQSRRPEWVDGKIMIPTRSTSIKDMLAVVPADWDVDVEIFVLSKGEAVMSLFLPPR